MSVHDPIAWAAEKVPPAAEVFFRGPAFARPQISPDGHRLAALTRHDDHRYALTMIDLESRRAQVLVKQPGLSVSSFAWKGDDVLLVSLQNDEGANALQSIDLRTGQANPLNLLNTERRGRVASFLFGDPKDVICPWNDGTLRRVDVRTGKSVRIERDVPGMKRWVFDAAGIPWAGLGYLGERWIFIWRSSPSAPWQRREEPGIHRPSIDPLALMRGGGRLAVIERMPGRPARLASFDLTRGSTEEIFQHDRVDVGTVQLWGHRPEPAAAVYVTDREQRHAFLPEAAACYGLVATALPEHDTRLISFSRDNQRIVVEAKNDRDCGAFYLLDRSTGQLMNIGAAEPALPSSALSPSRWLEFSSRDGVPLSGRITLPRDVPRPPLLVRFGPNLVGPRATNTFDPIAQFLASRGIATVRFHPRGTEGFGLDFLRAGDLEITSRVLDDTEDGIAAAVKHGYVDEKRIGLLGMDDGGISAFHAAARGGFRALVNLNTPMVIRNRDLEQLVPSDRDNVELTALAGGSAQAIAYIHSLDPLQAARRLRIPSFHWYPPGETAHEMTESGRLLKSALRKATLPAVFHLDPLAERNFRFDPFDNTLRDLNYRVPLRVTKPMQTVQIVFDSDETVTAGVIEPAAITARRFEALVAFLNEHLGGAAH